jgi:hypothetical protein
VGEVLEIKCADKPPDADLNLVRLAVMDGPEFDAEKVQTFPEAGEVFLIAGKTIERFDKDDIEGAVPRRIHHLHQAVAAQNRGTGPCPVIVNGGDLKAVLRRIGAAEGDLVINRAFVLKFG